MEKWEYMWMYVDNGERLNAQTYTEAPILSEKGWELVAVVLATVTSTPTRTFAQFCLKRPLSDEPTHAV